MEMSLESFPAPALARGFRVLELLSEAGDLSLAALAQRLGYPKASLLRLLDTLIMLNCVSRDAHTKTYSALVTVVPRDAGRFIRVVVRREMERLTGLTELTSEWYELASGGLEIVDLCDPPHAVVYIRARLGFQRAYEDELEAVTRVALGVGLYDYRACRYWQYDSAGERPFVSAAERDRQIGSAGQSRVAMDCHWNANGLRRYAAAVLVADRLVGILALTEAFTPTADARIERNLSALQESVAAIGARLQRSRVAAGIPVGGGDLD